MQIAGSDHNLIGAILKWCNRLLTTGTSRSSVIELQSQRKLKERTDA
jgi:hypothetical protein